jgi:hypothetical protein
LDTPTQVTKQERSEHFLRETSTIVDQLKPRAASLDAWVGTSANLKIASIGWKPMSRTPQSRVYVDFHPASPNTDCVRRASGFILLMSLFFASSGLAGYLHQLEHLGGVISASPTRLVGTFEPGHDESNCSICLNLHAPALAAPIVVTLVCLGIFVAFLTQLAPLLVSQRTLARIDCRGPPAR